MSTWSRRLLLRMYPKSWRQRYGAEFTELLDATPMTVFVALDVARHAAVERIRNTGRAWRILSALACFAVLDALAVRMQITDNLFWSPNTPARGAMLAFTGAPLAAIALLARPRKKPS